MANGYWGKSKTPANNAEPYPGTTWPEGQKPSTVNNSARNDLAYDAMFLEDQSGTLAVGGTANALTIAPTSALTDLSLAGGVFYTLRPASNNTGAATLAVSGLTAKAIRKIVGGTDVDVAAGDLRQGKAYRFTYSTTANGAAGAWLLHDGSSTTNSPEFLPDATTGGTANAITLTPASPVPAYADGKGYILKAANSNTGAATLNIGGLGAKAIRKISFSTGLDVDVGLGDILAGRYYEFIYSAAANGAAGAWVMTNDPPNSPPFPAATEFNSSGTWNKLSTATFVLVECWSAGSGGGSGRRGATSSERYGGGGGGGGSYAYRLFFASELTSSVSVTIGAGGAGGAAITTDSTNGSAGTAGGDTSFGTYLTTYGGAPGAGGTTSVGTASAGGGVLGPLGVPINNAAAHFGGSSDTRPSASGFGGGGGGVGIDAGGSSYQGAGGGGVGARKNASNADVVATAGGSTAGATGGGGAVGTAGVGRQGGGGGTFGSAGGAGGSPGGGGGGGGGGTNGTNSGAGGAGGNGRCRVYSW